MQHFLSMDRKFLRGWSQEELDEHLARAQQLGRNFTLGNNGLPAGSDWRSYHAEAVVGHERPGVPIRGGVFDRLQSAVSIFEFSDPRMVAAHFDPDQPLLGRRVLLEIHALGFHVLCPTLISEVMDRQVDSRTLFGFRYDTLEGHVKQGAEWFLLKKDHETGDVIFRIEAIWKPARLSKLWMRVGFRAIYRTYQEGWHQMAFLRLRQAAGVHPIHVEERPEKLKQSSRGRRSASAD